MRHLIKLILNSGILLALAFCKSSYSKIEAKEKTKQLLEEIGPAKVERLQVLRPNKDKNLGKLSKQIEKSFNTKDLSLLNKVIKKEISLDLQAKYLSFEKDFPNAKWIIKPEKTLKDKRPCIALSITAKKAHKNQVHSLEAKQIIAIEIEEGKIVGYEILNEYSITKKTSRPINITLSIPNTALTGSWYDVDIILDEPLKSSIIAGSLILFEEEKKSNIFQEDLPLKPMGSGGLFKSVQAPLKPGNQRWAALIAHPDGVISITKLVRVVSDIKDMSL